MTLEVVKEPAAEEAIPKELTDKVSALRSLTTIYNLLSNGHYPYREAHAIPQSLMFITMLHTNVKVECLAHPDCDKVPELVTLKEQERTVEQD